MRTLIGSLFLLLALALAVFVGGYVMLYGGIKEIVDGVNSTPNDSTEIAVGIIRVVFFETAGFFAGIIPAVSGLFLIGWAANDGARRAGVPKYTDRLGPRGPRIQR